MWHSSICRLSCLPEVALSISQDVQIQLLREPHSGPYQLLKSFVCEMLELLSHLREYLQYEFSFRSYHLVDISALKWLHN